MLYEGFEKVNDYTYVALSSKRRHPVIIKTETRISEPAIWQKLEDFYFPAMPLYYGKIKLPDSKLGYCFEYRKGSSIIEFSKGLERKERWQLISEIVSEYRTLQHEISERVGRPVVHGDIKPEHIRRADNGQIFFIDWEQAKYCDKQYESLGVNPFYSAPEVLKGVFDVNSDIYSLAKVAIAILCGESVSSVQHGVQLAFLEHCTVEELGALRIALSSDPAQRVGCYELFNKLG